MNYKNEISSNLIENLPLAICDAFSTFNDFLIIDRNVKGDFLNIFSDSLFTYNRGIILIERFFHKDHCNKKTINYTDFSEADMKLFNDFSEFAKTASEDGSSDAKKEMDNLYSKIKDVKKNATKAIEVYCKKDLILVPVNTLDSDKINSLSNLYSYFIISFLQATTWNAMSKTSLCLTCVDHSEYIDLIAIPVK